MASKNKPELILDASKIDVGEIERKYPVYIRFTRRYFDELSRWWWYGLGIVILFATCAVFEDNWGFLAACIAIACLFIWRIYNYYFEQTNDKRFDNILKIIKKKFAADATDKLGISPSDFVRDSLDLDAPDFDSLTGDDFKCGRDDITRYAKHNIHLFFFTQKYLASYHAKLDLKTGIVSAARTEEFFYKDVVSVGVQERDDDGSEGEYFILRNSGGGRIKVLLKNTSDDSGKNDEVIDNADNVVNSIRALLRDMK